MRVGEICMRDVVIVNKEGSILDAAQLMREFHVGDVVVVEERDGRTAPIGLLTDRDIVVELIAEDVDFNAVAIKDVMSFKLITATEDESLDDAIDRMRDHGVRRLPVVDAAGALVGVLAADDLVDLSAEQLVSLVRLVSNEQRHERMTRH